MSAFGGELPVHETASTAHSAPQLDPAPSPRGGKQPVDPLSSLVEVFVKNGVNVPRVNRRTKSLTSLVEPFGKEGARPFSTYGTF